jgi:hypothetical protein
MRIRLQEGKNDPQKKGKVQKFDVFEMLDCSLMRAEGGYFSGGLGVNCNFYSKNIFKKFQLNFSNFVINLVSRTGSGSKSAIRKMPDPH